MMAKAVHVVAMAMLFIAGCGVTGGALTPEYGAAMGIPWAIAVVATMKNTGWYFCD